MNSVLAFVLTTMLGSWILHEYRTGWIAAVLHPVYLLSGSLILGYAASWAALLGARWVGKNADRHFVLLLALVVLTIGTARMLGVPVLLALLAFGVFSRNLDERHDLMAVDLTGVGQVFFVVLFVVTGARFRFADLAAGGALAVVYVLARFAGKSMGVMCLTWLSGVRRGSAGLLCLALTPMSVFALVLVHDIAGLHPEFGTRLAAIVVSAALILELAGPVAVQFALRRAGETGAGDP